MAQAVLETQLPFPVRRGKVRDVYDVAPDQLLIVATDRISAFDCVMPSGIPDKGRLLTAMSVFWFDLLKEIVPNHLITTDISKMPPKAQKMSDQIRDRSMLVRKTRVIPIECVARGYLAGSGWSEYQKTGSVCGHKLKPEMSQCAKLPRTIFTPSTKVESDSNGMGHDENITFTQMADRIGKDLAVQLRSLTLKLYEQAASHAKARGVIIADTKFEFGQLDDGSVILIDEALTPDSSRFWPASQYEQGHDQPSFDKQYVRNWLSAQFWNKQPPAPPLPPEVIVGTRQRYIEAYERITGEKWAMHVGKLHEAR